MTGPGIQVLEKWQTKDTGSPSLVKLRIWLGDIQSVHKYKTYQLLLIAKENE